METSYRLDDRRLSNYDCRLSNYDCRLNTGAWLSCSMQLQLNGKKKDIYLCMYHHNVLTSIYRCHASTLSLRILHDHLSSANITLASDNSCFVFSRRLRNQLDVLLCLELEFDIQLRRWEWEVSDVTRWYFESCTVWMQCCLAAKTLVVYENNCHRRFPWQLIPLNEDLLHFAVVKQIALDRRIK